MNKIKVLYMGTPDFAVPALEILNRREDIEVIGVVTQPDKEKGRGYKLMPPPVKQKAEELGIPVFQPLTIKDDAFSAQLTELNPNLIVVAAYGKILPPFVIHYPKYGCINIHASLLPKYRGAAPIHWCLINGESKTGVTIMEMDEGLDTGDILYQKEYEIDKSDTTGILFDKMAILGAEALSEAIDLMQKGELKAKKQDDSLSCYSPMIEKSFSRIDFTKPAKEIADFVRGLNPFPGAKAYRSDGKMLKILFANEICERTDLKPGTVIDGEKSIKIASGNGTVLEVTYLQPEGSKAMDTKTFLLGRSLENGEILN